MARSEDQDSIVRHSDEEIDMLTAKANSLLDELSDILGKMSAKLKTDIMKGSGPYEAR